MSNDSRLVVNFQKIDMHETPVLVLKTPSGRVIQTLGYANNIECSFKFNETSELTFDVPARVNGESVPGYDKIVGEMYIDMVGWGMFILQNPSTKIEGSVETKSCKAYSLEYELTHKRVYFEEGTYNFWNPALPEGTIMQYMLEVSPGWSVGYIDPSLIGRYRTFDDTQDSVYSVMKNTLQDPYGCMFYFDTYNKTINAIEEYSTIQTAQVYLSTDNLIKELDIDEDDDSLVTVLDVYGADDVDIRSVNPIGNKIYNIDYFMNDTHFDQEMIEKWSMWKLLFENTRSSFFAASIKKATKRSEQLTLNAKLTDEQATLDTYEAEQSVYVQTQAEMMNSDEDGYNERTDLISDKLADIKQKIADQTEVVNGVKAQIDTVDQEIATLTTEIESMRDEVLLTNYFTEEEYDSLTPYFIEDSLEESSFVFSDVVSFVSDNDSIANKTINIDVSDCNLTRVLQQSAKSSQVYSDMEVEGVVTAVSEAGDGVEERTIKVTTVDGDELYYKTEKFNVGEKVLVVNPSNGSESIEDDDDEDSEDTESDDSNTKTAKSVQLQKNTRVELGTIDGVNGIVVTGTTDDGNAWKYYGVGYNAGDRAILVFNTEKTDDVTDDELSDAVSVKESDLYSDNCRTGFVTSIFDDDGVPKMTINTYEDDVNLTYILTYESYEFSLNDKVVAILDEDHEGAVNSVYIEENTRISLGNVTEVDGGKISGTTDDGNDWVYYGEDFSVGDDVVLLFNTNGTDNIEDDELVDAYVVDRMDLLPEDDVVCTVDSIDDGDRTVTFVDSDETEYTVPTNEFDVDDEVVAIVDDSSVTGGPYLASNIRMMYGTVTNVFEENVEGTTEDGNIWKFKGSDLEVEDHVAVLFNTNGTDDNVKDDEVIDVYTLEDKALYSERDYRGIVSSIVEEDGVRKITVATAEDEGDLNVSYSTGDFTIGQDVVVVVEVNDSSKASTVCAAENTRVTLGRVVSSIGTRVRVQTDDGHRWLYIQKYDKNDDNDYEVVEGDYMALLFNTNGTDDFEDDELIDAHKVTVSDLLSDRDVEMKATKVEGTGRTINCVDSDGNTISYVTTSFKKGDNVIVVCGEEAYSKNEDLYLLSETRESLGVVTQSSDGLAQGTTEDGNQWIYYGTGYEVGDDVVVLFDTSGTSDLEDDKVIDVILRKNSIINSVTGGTVTITYEVESGTKSTDETTDETTDEATDESTDESGDDSTTKSVVTKTVTAEIKRGTIESLENGVCTIGIAIGSGSVVVTTDGVDGEPTSISGGTITLYGKTETLNDDTSPSEKTPNVIYEGKSLTCVITDATMYVTEDLTLMEEYSVELELYEYAVKELNKVAYPSYKFKLDTANFLALDDFISFTNSLELGSRVMVDMGDKVLTPILLEVEIAFNDLSSLSLSFSDTYNGSDNAFNLVDLIEESVSMGHKLDLSKYTYSAFVNSGVSTAVKDFMDNALDASKNKIINSSGQGVTIDETGIRLRKPVGDGTFEDEQIWMINNNIVFTDDGWASAKMAIGSFHDDNFGDTWGIVAPSIVGTLLAGENLVIESKKTATSPSNTQTSIFKVDSDGASLYNAKFELITPQTEEGKYNQLLLDPELGIGLGTYPITRDKEDGSGGIEWDDKTELDNITEYGNAKFFVDMDGNLHFRGTLDGADGKFSGTLEVGKPNERAGLYIDKDGNLAVGGKLEPGTEGEVDIDDDDEFDTIAYFYVKNNGTMYARQGEFDGTVYADNMIVRLEDGTEASFLADHNKINSNLIDLGNITLDGETGDVSIGGNLDLSDVTQINFGDNDLFKTTYEYSVDGTSNWHTTLADEDVYARPVYADGSYGPTIVMNSGYLPSYIKATHIDLTQAASPSFMGNNVYAQSFYVVESFTEDSDGGYKAGSTVGWMGEMTGFAGEYDSDGNAVATEGVGLGISLGTPAYVIATTAGARLQCGYLDRSIATGWSSAVTTTSSAYLASGNMLKFGLYQTDNYRMEGGVYTTNVTGVTDATSTMDISQTPKSIISATESGIEIHHNSASTGTQSYVAANDANGVKLFAGVEGTSADIDMSLSGGISITGVSLGTVSTGLTSIVGGGGVSIATAKLSTADNYSGIVINSDGNVSGTCKTSFNVSVTKESNRGINIDSTETFLGRDATCYLKMNTDESTLKYGTSYMGITSESVVVSRTDGGKLSITEELLQLSLNGSVYGTMTPDGGVQFNGGGSVLSICGTTLTFGDIDIMQSIDNLAKAIANINTDITQINGRLDSISNVAVFG